MANRLFKEPFVGKYDGMTPATILPLGGLVGGENVRKVSEKGGWKVRKGCALHNTTAVDSTHGVKSLHRYENPRSEDYHFLAQCNSLLYDATKDPPDLTGTTFGTSLGLAIGVTPGFSCVVREDLFYADGSGRPIAWGGDTPYCSGFLVWDNSESAYIDYTRNVTDGRSGTLAVLGNAASDVYYVCSSEIASGIILDLTTVNTTDTAVCKVYSWVAGAWQERSTGYDDGTLVSGKTHARDGTIAWTVNSTDTMRILGGMMGYWYKVEPQSTYLTDGVTVNKCQVVRAASLLTNKWSGVWEWVAGCRFYDQSAGEYVEALGRVSNESESQNLNLDAATTSDYVYFKTLEPATAVGLGMTTDEQNTAASLVDLIEHWDGSAFTTVGTLTDTTKDNAADSSLSQSGSISWNATALTPQKRTWQGDEIPGYWYRISWAVDLSASVSIFMMVYAPFPEVLPAYDGCVQFKGRLMVWGDPEFPNRLRFSALDRPDCFSGSDSGYTDPFGDMKKVLCAIPFHNELIVFKEDSVFLLEGYNKQTFGIMKIADRIGLASPKTAVVIETGSPAMHKDEALSIAIWQDVDGIYMLDGRKPRKCSLPIDRYFNQEYSECIAKTSIRNRQAFSDPLNNEYHFLLPSGELVYNYITDEWYPPWDRELDLDTGLVLKGTDNRYYTYGGTSGGFVCQLESDTTDKNVSDEDVKIDHSIKTRAIAVDQKVSTFVEFVLRGLWTELKARSSGSIVTTVFKNMKTTGVVEAIPQAMSMVNSGYGIATPGIDLDYENCACFQVEFSSSVADKEMEIWSMLYELDIGGEIVV